MQSKAEARPLVNHAVLVERYIHDAKHFQLYTSFAPNLSAQSVTGKFYSKYEQTDPTTCNPAYVKLIENKAKATPRDLYPEPITSSHWVGWYATPLLEDQCRNDQRIYRPRNYTEISRFGEMLMRNKK